MPAMKSMYLSFPVVLVIILGCALGRRARRGREHQKAPSHRKPDEAETYMGNWQLAPRETEQEGSLNVEEYFSMFSAHGSNGEGNVMQNQANGEDNWERRDGGLFMTFY